MSKSKNLCKASALTLSALTAGCQLYPPTVCGPTFDGLSPNAQVVYEVSPVYGEDPRHLIPEYSFEGQPGETVTQIGRASCRERVWTSVVAGALHIKKKDTRSMRHEE